MNLERHIDKAVEHFQKAYSKLDDWSKEKNTAMERFKTEAPRLTEQAAKDENARLTAEFNEKRDAIVAELTEAVGAVEADFSREAKAFYAPDGAAINAADQALLASGIMNAAEVSEMVVRHADNPTMIRIINKYVQESRMELPTDIRKAIHRATSGGENEKKVFDTFRQLAYAPVRMAEQGMAGSEHFMATALKVDEYAKDAKIRLLSAKLYLNESEREQLRKAEREAMDKHNSKIVR